MALVVLLSLLLFSCQPSSTNTAVANTPESVLSVEEKAPLQDTAGTTISTRFAPPVDYTRVDLPAQSFGAYLRQLPLKSAGSSVFLFNGDRKFRQDVHAAVIDLDVGNRDLQQCADAVMRLRAEYLWSQEAYDEISFQFTNGFPAVYNRWRAGERIRVAGNDVSWVRQGQMDTSYRQFRQYLNMAFAYAGTLSLANELEPRRLQDINVGDVFVQGGSPGHAVIVVDMAKKEGSDTVMIMLAQSYMPAQDIHVLKNPRRTDNWYPINADTKTINTPEWTFYAQDLKHF